MKKKRGRALESRSVLRSASSDVSFMVVYAGLKVSNEQKTKEKTITAFLECPENFSAKAICEITNRLFWKADLFVFKATKRKITEILSVLEIQKGKRGRAPAY